MLLKFKAEAKSLRPRLKGPEAKDEAEARGYETEAKILTSRPVWPRGFHISDAWTYVLRLFRFLRTSSTSGMFFKLIFGPFQRFLLLVGCLFYLCRQFRRIESVTFI